MIEAVPRDGRVIANISQTRLIELLDATYKAGQSDFENGLDKADLHVDRVITQVYGNAVDIIEYDEANSQLEY